MRNQNFVQVLWLAIWLCAFSSSVAQEAQEKQKTQEHFKYASKIDALVQPHLDNQKFNSAVIGVISKDQVWIKGYGQLSETDKTTPDKDTLYEIGSISKVFTAVMLADAVKQGHLKLDQTIGTLIDGMNEGNEEVGKSITLQHLSQHMSGLPKMPSNLSPKDPGNPFASYGRKQLYSYMKDVTPFADPNEKNIYSNLAVGLLGTLVADNAGKTYEEVLTERVLEPLGMNDTSLKIEGDRKRRFAPPHNMALLPGHSWDFDSLAGCGAIRSSASDMLKFAKANLDPPKNEIGGALELAWKKQLDAGSGHAAMGLGWMIIPDPGGTHWHNGQTGGYHAMLLVNRKLETATVLLANTASLQLDALTQEVFRACIGLPTKPNTFAAEFKVKEDVVKRLVGKYQLAPGMILDVTAKGTKMMAQLTGQGALSIIAESETTWRYELVDAKLVFKLPDDDKPATKATLHQNGKEMPSPRIE